MAGQQKDLPIVTFAQLSSAKIVLSSPKQQYYVVERFFLQNCMRTVTEQIPFDEEWYVQKYPDISEAIKRGAVLSGHDHYIQHGYFEHRLPFRIVVESKWYLEQNPDVREAIEKRHFASAQQHFEIVGFREGRPPYAKFDILNAFAQSQA